MQRVWLRALRNERRDERLVMLYTDPGIAPARIVEHLGGLACHLSGFRRRTRVSRRCDPGARHGKVDLAKARAIAMEKMQAQPENTVEQSQWPSYKAARIGRGTASSS